MVKKSVLMSKHYKIEMPKCLTRAGYTEKSVTGKWIYVNINKKHSITIYSQHVVCACVCVCVTNLPIK